MPPPEDGVKDNGPRRARSCYSQVLECRRPVWLVRSNLPQQDAGNKPRSCWRCLQLVRLNRSHISILVWMKPVAIQRSTLWKFETPIVARMFKSKTWCTGRGKQEKQNLKFGLMHNIPCKHSLHVILFQNLEKTINLCNNCWDNNQAVLYTESGINYLLSAKL